MKSYLRLIIKALLLISILTITLVVLYGFKLNQQINSITEEGWFPPTTQVFAAGETLYQGAFLNETELDEILMSSNFIKQTTSNSFTSSMSYKKLSKNECLFNADNLISQPSSNIDIELLNSCIILNISQQKKGLIGLSLSGHILFLAQHNELTQQITLPSYPIAQYQNDKPFLTEKIEIGDVPLYCLQAITAVEDKAFLKHHGISVKGILRAILKNIQAGRRAEGASTITQQLVKNYFLTHKRTYKRKFKEILMSVILEFKVSKDDILSNYLNVIYLGQSDNFQVIGYSAASKHYFNKNIGQLNLNECALLAAIVNSPGLFNPFTRPENALKRRGKVLQHMLDNQFINQTEFEQANKSSLPSKPIFSSTKSSAYFLDAISKEVKKLNLDHSAGLKVYTSISPLRQIHAQEVITNSLKDLEKKIAKKGKEITLQASLINVDIKTGHIKALIGGRGFRQTQFNRPLTSKRQVGSIMKPFVYLTALEKTDDKGNNHHALSLLDDKIQTYKYEGQTWTPRNYSRSYQGKVPLFYALKNSLNAPTAALGMQLGVDSVIEMSKRLGITSPLKPYPSLFLGALELSQLELLQAYTNIAHQGLRVPNSFVQKITNNNDDLLYQVDSSKKQQLIRKDISSQIISILEQTTATGTARSLKTWRKFSHPIAGKTGTTNDTKDAWFVGFTPDSLTLIWVGNDKSLATGLTGASGALPIWASYMKKVLKLFPVENNFPKNESTKEVAISSEQIKFLVPKAREHELVDTNINMPVNYQPEF